MIEIKNVTKKYGNYVAVEDISFKVEESSIYGLVGYNGAGKTTLISIISGLLKADGGDVYVDGLSVTSRADDVKKLIAVSPQETAVAPNLTVKENLEFFAELYGKPKDRAIIAIDEFRLTEVADKRAKALSGGYARRLSVAAALITEPKVLILDEPTLGLDVVARRELWKILGERAGSVTTVLTTHYLEEAEALCDRVGILKEGVKIFDGTVESLKVQTGENSFEDAFVKISAETIEG